jgi:hypothetical protein
MNEQASNERAAMASNPYSITGEAGHYTVKFQSPHNAVHQVSGFKSEDDAQAWITDTRRITKTSR